MTLGADDPNVCHAAAGASLATTTPWWWSLAVALLVSLLVYLPAAVGAQLLSFDDPFFFGPASPFQRGCGVVFDPSQPIANAFLPVAHLSLYCDYALTGAAPFWPHLHALLLHGLAGAVLIRLLLTLGLAPLAAHAAGVLFLVHPALAESVAWVSGRKDVLSGLFVFAALWTTVRWTRAPVPVRWHLPALALLAALAMYSKPTAVVLPLLAFAVVVFLGGSRRRWWAPALLLLVTLPIAWHHQQIAALEGTMAGGSPLARLVQVPGAFLHYLSTSLWPLRLNVLYPEVATLERFAADAGVGGVVLTMVVIAAALAWWARSWRGTALGVSAFVVALLPFNTAFPASAIAAADRYLYLAVPGLAFAVVAVAVRLAPRRGPWFAVALAVPLAWLAGGRAQVFRDDETLWRASLAEDEGNAVAHLNLVNRLLQGDFDVAVVRSHLQRAVAAARYPIHELRARQLLLGFALAAADYPAAAVEARAAVAAAERQLASESAPKRVAEAGGLLLAAQLAAFEPLRLAGEAVAAAAVFTAAVQRAPEHPDVIAFGAMRDLAACVDALRARAARGEAHRLRADDPRGAAADAALGAALAQHPDHAALLLAQAEWDRARDRALPALRNYKRARTRNPLCIEAWRGEVQLLRERGLHEEAIATAQAGLREGRPDPTLRQEVALALVALGRIDDAELQLRTYMQQRPDDRDMARVLANVLSVRAYQKLAEGPAARAEVVRLIEAALHYFPDEPRAQLVLGRLARDDQRLAAAAEHFRVACERMPDLEEPRLQYAESLAALGYQRLLRRDDEKAADAWRLCVQHAPAGFDFGEIKNQLRRIAAGWEKKGAALRSTDPTGAVTAFRRCLQIVPDQPAVAWQLALLLSDTPDADLVELERLARAALVGQQALHADAGPPTLLLATTLARAGRMAESRRLATDYLQRLPTDAKPQVVDALRRLADG